MEDVLRQNSECRKKEVIGHEARTEKYMARGPRMHGFRDDGRPARP
jgi:hypothetical protein